MHRTCLRLLFLSSIACLPLAGVGFAQAPTPRGQSTPAAPQTHQAAVQKEVEAFYPHLDKLYKHFHAHPELALQEEKTAVRLAQELRQLGLDVSEKVGGTGVVAVLKNGSGPIVLVRADMDALPIVEQTGLPYASKVRTRDAEGRDVGVMHACGHDINMTCLVGAARTLTKLKNHWSGTIVFVGQPAEENRAGARLMLADGLFKRFPRPDYCLALHCDARYPAGTVNFREGLMQANVDSVDVTVRGKGGHGAAPHTTIDPVVLAAKIILDLQTIVSREINPTTAGVVTVGSIHGGSKHNIIPGEVKLQLTVRTTTDQVRKQVLEAIARIVKAAAVGHNAPEPLIRISLDDYTPALVNDGPLTRRLVGLFQKVLGPERVSERPMSMGGEDFSQFVRAGVPGFYYHLGSVPAERVAEAKKPGGRPLATTHSDAYFPVPEPTIKTGVLTMSLAVMDLLAKKG